MSDPGMTSEQRAAVAVHNATQNRMCLNLSGNGQICVACSEVADQIDAAVEVERQAAEERGRRAGIEEAARMIAREGDRNRGGDYELQLARLAGRVAALALAPRDSAPARYCDEPHPDRPLRCGRFVKHDGPHTAFVPGFEDEQRAAVHWPKEDRK